MNSSDVTKASPSEQLVSASYRLPNHTLSELLVPLSGAIDLAEGRESGHAQRVAYIALAVAGAMDLEPREQLAACYAGLFHDIGVVAAGTGLSNYTRGDERMVFSSMPLLTPEEAAVTAGEFPLEVEERIIEHAIHGGRAAQELNLPSEAVVAISAHHENWNGSGYPYGLTGSEIPLLARIVGLSDHIEALIGQVSPLVARRNLHAWMGHLSGAITDPELISVFRHLSNSDSFWLGLFSSDLPQEIIGICSRSRENRVARLSSFANSFSQLIDSRLPFMTGVSQRVASLTEALGRALQLPEPHLKQLKLAALLHDLGQLSVSERIMSKPAILTVEELDIMRLHPLHSHDVIAGIRGLEEVASWVAAHHERLDGKGYPEGLQTNEIPLESRILAIVDAYVSMTSDRPHRERSQPEEVKQRLLSAAGSQLDAELLDLFLHKVV